MPYPEATIAIHQGVDRPRKAVRLLTMRDGSFSISAPYHPATSGILAKIAEPKVLIGPGVGDAHITESYRVDARVKFTYHVSGFAQFSSADGPGKRIRSGRTPPTQFLVPKGIGVHAQPFTDPILTGPSCGISFFNLRECQPLEDEAKGQVILFEEGQFFERDDHDGRSHGFTVSIFVFPADARRNAI
jgi:hypothetical protein